MPRKIRALIFALAVVLVLPVVTALFWSKGGTQPFPPLPNPNGYDDFLKAAELITGDPYTVFTLDHDGLRALVSTNAESLRLLRLGLSRQCALPTESAMTNVYGMIVKMSGMKRLVQLLAAEGRLREMDNKFAEAAQSYVDAIQFGNEISRGGFMVNRLVGISFERIGNTPLGTLAPQLNSPEAHRVVAALEQIESVGVTWEEVQRNEKRFAHYLRDKEFHPIDWAMSQWQNRRSSQTAKVMHQRVAAHVRLVTAELAVRCYQLDQGRAPTSLEELVPKYLQRVPLDPFSTHPMIYRQQGTNWLLYSIGEDGVDDDGKRVARSVSSAVTSGDIYFDSPY